MGSAVERLLAMALRRLPPGRRELGQALLAELPAVPAGRARMAWIVGGMWFVVKENAMRRLGYLVGLVAGAAVLVVVDRLGTSDDAGQVSLLVLLCVSGVLGFAAPRLAWLAGLVIGAALAVADTVYLSLGYTVFTDSKPGGYAGAALMLVLTIPAMAAAYLGAGAALLVRRARG